MDHKTRGAFFQGQINTQRLKEAGIDPSVGKTGSAYDNALAETINGLYKTELTKRQSLNSPRLNGFTGLITNVFLALLETCLLQRLKTCIMINSIKEPK